MLAEMLLEQADDAVEAAPEAGRLVREAQKCIELSEKAENQHKRE